MTRDYVTATLIDQREDVASDLDCRASGARARERLRAHRSELGRISQQRLDSAASSVPV